MESVINTFSNDWNYIVRLLVAMVLGGLVGFERQKRGRSAGLRTNILVCIGSAAIIITFQKLSSEIGYNADSLLRMDPARAAAGVITGIGFLGAGTIIKSQDFILGLTTAASIWVVSAVGVTIGLLTRKKQIKKSVFPLKSCHPLLKKFVSLLSMSQVLTSVL